MAELRPVTSSRFWFAVDTYGLGDTESTSQDPLTGMSSQYASLEAEFGEVTDQNKPITGEESILKISMNSDVSSLSTIGIGTSQPFLPDFLGVDPVIQAIESGGEVI